MVRCLIILVVWAANVAVDAQDASALVISGNSRLQKKDYFGAITDFSAALKADNKNFEALYGKAQAELALNNIDNALADLSRALIIDDTHAPALSMQGDILIGRKDYEGALQAYDAVLKHHPIDLYAINQKILIAFLSGKSKEPLREIDLEITKNPGFPDFYYTRGLVNMSRQKPDKALADFSSAIEKGLTRKLFECYLNRGMAFQSLQEYDNALADFARAIELNPNNSLAYHGRGMANYELKNYDEAVNDFQRTIELGYTGATAFYNLGMAYSRKNDMDNACANLRKACDMGHENACKKALFDCTGDL